MIENKDARLSKSIKYAYASLKRQMNSIRSCKNPHQESIEDAHFAINLVLDALDEVEKIRPLDAEESDIRAQTIVLMSTLKGIEERIMAKATRNSAHAWTCMSDKAPPEGVTFVMTSSKWKARQYVVKNQWTKAEQKNNAKSLSCLYWMALPPLPIPKEEAKN